MKKTKVFDIIVLILWPLVAVYISLTFHINALMSSIVFYGIPALFISLKNRHLIYKGLVFGLFSIPLMLFIDYIAETTGTWLWPLPHSVLPRIFGVVSFEVILWAFLHFFFVVIFYEYFFDRHKVYKVWSKRSGMFFIGTIILFGLFLALFNFAPHFLNIPFWYLILGIVFVIPPILFEERLFPRVFLKILRASAYFFYINLIYELTALTVQWWSFPSNQFVGWVSFRGITFPLEEFFFWVTLFTIAILSYYEYFFDAEHVYKKDIYISN